MVWFDGCSLGVFCCAFFDFVAASFGEVASLGQVCEVGGLSGYGVEAGSGVAVDSWDGVEESDGVWVRWFFEDVGCRSVLDDSSGVHDVYAFDVSSDDAEVVGYEQ